MMKIINFKKLNKDKGEEKNKKEKGKPLPYPLHGSNTYKLISVLYWFNLFSPS